MKKIVQIVFSIFGMFLLATFPAFAHVIVHPSSVGVAAFQEFTMTVPTETDNPTVAVKLLIPSGLKSVTPNVKSGWMITEVKKGTGDDAIVTEIDWTGGSIPSGQRDDFVFQAQVPSTEITLNWKAYQTYSDGSVISWDHDPKLSRGPDDDGAPPPYSTTKIVNDFKDQTTMSSQSMTSDSDLGKKANNAAVLSTVALALSLIALGRTAMKKK